MNVTKDQNSIFNYQDPHLFLLDHWRWKKEKNPAFSIRSWSRQLGFKAHNSLYEVMKGKRRIPKKQVPLFIRHFKFTTREGMYFEAIVDMNRAQTAQEKELYVERIREIVPKARIQLKTVESFRFLRNPLHTVLLELSALRGFRSDPAWIKGKLSFPTSVLEIENALQTLSSLGLIQRDAEGEVLKVHPHLYSKIDKEDQALQEYHINVMRLASNAVKEQPILKREFNAYSINILEKDFPLAKEKIHQFLSEFAQTLEASKGEGEKTYQLAVQFFGLTN